MHKISNVVTEVYKFAQEIGAATNEQSHGSSQIARATTRLNEITHEINSAVEEQASGAQAVVKAMERMRELVQQIHLQVRPNWRPRPSRCRRCRAACWTPWTASRCREHARGRRTPMARGRNARRAAAGAQLSTGADIMSREFHIVGFQVGRETYGVPITSLHEIVRVPEITAVPDAPEYLEGVINLRGKIVSVIDLRKRFGEKQDRVKQAQPHSGRRA